MCKPTPADTEIKPSSESDSAAGGGGMMIVSRSELASHNSPSSAWCAIHRRASASPTAGGGDGGGEGGGGGHVVLDITKFASVHPGGDLILLAAGKDASILFETYHPRGVPTSLVEKLRIGTMESDSFPGGGSYYSWTSDFYPTLKSRVVKRISDLGLERRGSAEIQLKAVFLLCGFWYSLLRMLYATTNDDDNTSSSSSSSFAIASCWSISMGIFAALVGTNVQHDGNHGAFAKSKYINKIAGWTMDMIGASAFTWEMQHMLGHHPYTNVLDVIEEERKATGEECEMEEKDQESDPDVFSSFPLMRMHPLHTPSWYHRYQHLYAPILFAVMTLAKVFQQDFEVATSKRLYHIDATVRYGSYWNVARFWIMKFVTMTYMLVLPMYLHGIPRGLALFVIGHLACGELLATMFIVNHVIEGVSYGRKDLRGGGGGDDDGKEEKMARGKPTTMTGNTPMERTREEAFERSILRSDETRALPSVPFNDWAAVQCQTSVNWAPGSWFWNHFSGGLSHQIEHHLFPSICHTNYVYIQDVVEKTCEEYGVPYQSEPSLWVAYGKMINHLRLMGRGKIE